MKYFITILLSISTLFSRDLICIVGGAQEPHWKVKQLATKLSSESFDVVAVRCHSRKGIVKSVTKFKKKLYRNNLEEYDAVHFYAFTLGGVVLKETLPELDFKPKRIVFIESPIENHISEIAQKTIPRWIMRIGTGQAVLELPEYKNNTLPDSVESALFITLGANRLAEKIQKRALKKFGNEPLYEEPLDPEHYGIDAADFFYSSIDHTELYNKPELYKNELLQFFENGSFGKGVDRNMCDDTFSFYPDVFDCE